MKHIYEIAKIKSEDPPLALLSLEDICKMMIGIAHTCGIEIVREIDSVEYAQFLEERGKVLEKFYEELRIVRESKMLRTSTQA